MSASTTDDDPQARERAARIEAELQAREAELQAREAELRTRRVEAELARQRAITAAALARNAEYTEQIAEIQAWIASELASMGLPPRPPRRQMALAV